MLSPTTGGPNQQDLVAPITGWPRSASDEPQFTSINQIGDLQPSDWAYKALVLLVEEYGCVAGYPNGTFAGNRKISRFEAAALLNRCLGRVNKTTDSLKRLLQEFGPELAILKGRTDGLEGRVGALEASQFSPTTTLSGKAVFVVGGNSFAPSDPVTDPSQILLNGTTFNYNIELSLDTSFTGTDLLRTVLRAGDFNSSPFGKGLSTLETAFESDAGPNILAIDKLFYQWPLGKGFTATVGARVGQDDMLALWPSVYPSDTILNVMTGNGAPAAYNKNLGPGAGLMWQGKHLSISANYVASNGASADPALGGLATTGSGASATVQMAYVADEWGLAAIYSLLQSGSQGIPGATPFVQQATSSMALFPDASTNAFGISGYWQPKHSGWWPSVSVGWGFNSTSNATAQESGSLSGSQSWLVGLQWKDALVKGNALGMAVGSPVFATALSGGVTPNDGSTVWEGWYKFQLTDQISLTAALFYLSLPFGQPIPPADPLSQLGALVKMSFRF